MNPLTNTRNIKALNENDIKNGIFDHRHTWHSQYKDSAYIFVGGLPYELSEGDIICVFSQCGEIVNINLVRDKKTGKSQGYCFICYEDQRSTILAVDNLNSIKLGGRTIRVDHVTDYRPPLSNEKDGEGNYKIKVEKGCAPKTPSPEPDDQDKKKSKTHKKEKKKKKKDKKEKKKKKKKKIDNESNSESTENEEDKKITPGLGKVVYKQVATKKPDSQWDKGANTTSSLNEDRDVSPSRRRSRSRSRSRDTSPPRKRNRSHSNESNSESTDREDSKITLGLGKMVYKKVTKQKPGSQCDKGAKIKSLNKERDISPSRRRSRSRSRSIDTSLPRKRRRSRSRSRDRDYQ